MTFYAAEVLEQYGLFLFCSLSLVFKQMEHEPDSRAISL